ncbi:MAG: GldG family protein [Alphaproteobacteria bacterium]|nr:GldG family protein [Alphaproteobacteria bacterium]
MALRGTASGFLASRRGLSIAALVCIVIMLVSANIVAARYLTARLDLTAEGLYTLSRGTRQTLAKIDEPITLRFYYSSRLGDEVPAYGVYAQRVRELLDQYVAAAHGKIRLEVYNPQPFSDVEDRAVSFGLQGVPLNEQGEPVYFGLAGTNSTDDTEIMAFFAPERERFLEYDLTKLVHTLAFPKKPVVGLMTALPLQGDMMAMMQGRPSEPMAIIEQLQQLYDIQPVSPGADAIPAGIDVLMLVHPQNLSEKTQFAVDQFVLKGGKALVFVDPYSEFQAARPSQLNPPGGPNASDLPRLFKAWGVQMLPKVVAGDRRDARKVGVPVPGGGAQPMDYIAWLNLRAPNLNRNDMITADIGQITMASAGILEPVPGAKTGLEPLISTSPESTRVPVEKLAGLPDVAGLLAHFKPDDKRYVLAAHITGTVESAFPDGPPKPPEPAPAADKPPGDKPAGDKPGDPAAASPAPAAAPAPAALKQSAQPVNVVVVADTDMLDDRFWAQTQDFFGQRVLVPVANNGDFVANAIDVLAGGEDLIGLRTRGSSARPFTVVERIQRSADERYSAERRELQDKLKQTQTKLQDLTAKEPGNGTASLSPEQTKAIDQFRADLLTTRQQLRDVQAALRSDIQGLKAMLEFLDIALVPMLVAAAAIVAGAMRLKRRRRRAAYA